jgi:hypothetical protein
MVGGWVAWKLRGCDWEGGRITCARRRVKRIEEGWLEWLEELDTVEMGLQQIVSATVGCLALVNMEDAVVMLEEVVRCFGGYISGHWMCVRYTRGLGNDVQPHDCYFISHYATPPRPRCRQGGSHQHLSVLRMLVMTRLDDRPSCAAKCAWLKTAVSVGNEGSMFVSWYIT